MGSEMEPAVVIGVAVVDGGRVLAARRTRPVEAAGRWEFPGGKVEPGESFEACAAREIAEELGCTVTATRVLDAVTTIREGLVLRVLVASLDTGTPVATEHDQLRWLTRQELHDVDWLDSDRPFLPEIERLLP